MTGGATIQTADHQVTMTMEVIYSRATGTEALRRPIPGKARMHSMCDLFFSLLLFCRIVGITQNLSAISRIMLSGRLSRGSRSCNVLFVRPWVQTQSRLRESSAQRKRSESRGNELQGLCRITKAVYYPVTFLLSLGQDSSLLQSPYVTRAPAMSRIGSDILQLPADCK